MSTEETQKPTGRFTRLKNLSIKQKISIVILTIIAVIFVWALFFIFTFNKNVGKTFQGSPLQTLTKSEPLKQDNNYTNTIIFGNSSDDPGHGGKLLTDSIMVVSYNNQTKRAYTISVPRDLWVTYDQNCVNGSEGKINALYQCGLRNNENDEQKAGDVLAQKVSGILGIPIHYHVKVNYGFVRDTVNALGGIDVTINSDDPRGIMDRTFDKNCPDGPYTCYNVRYSNGTHYIDGEHALYLARARNASGGYGLPESNFDRELNQQMIIEAMKQKALSSGTLSNPLKTTSLINAMGNNITTNIPTSQVRSVLDAMRDMGASKFVSVPLNDKNHPLVTTGAKNGQSIVMPTSGIYDYSELQSTIQQALAN